MHILIQKFGGTSLADIGCIQRAADKVINAKMQGRKVVVVVSAMGDETDHLIALANQLQDQPNPREYDQLLSCGEQKSMALLAMALENQGCKAISLTAIQAGIHTNAVHGHARIVDIDTVKILQYLQGEEVIIVAGFQGDAGGHVTTLGRGGSDLTAVALAAALKAEECQIFTDVAGVYSIDPRIIPKAQRLDTVSFDEMIELSHLGAKVLHHRAVLLARKMHVPLRVLSSFEPGEGTKITSVSGQKVNSPVASSLLVTGIACQEQQALVELFCSNSENLLEQLNQLLMRFHLTVASFSSAEQGREVEIKIILPVALVRRVEELLVGLFEGQHYQLLKQMELTQLSIVGVGVGVEDQAAKLFYTVLSQHSVKIRHAYANKLTISALIEVNESKKIIEDLFVAFQLEPGGQAT